MKFKNTKQRTFLYGMIFIFAVEIAALFLFTAKSPDPVQDTVEVNEAVQSVQADWDNLDRHKNQTELDYVVLDTEGNVLFRTRTGLSESINEAVAHKDTMLDIETGGILVGKIIIYNDRTGYEQQSRTIVLVFSVAIFLQAVVCSGYFFYLYYTMVRPFQKLKGFAERIAGGNLDIPLQMDKQNLFGAFTEAFDIMRSELKKARIAEAEANASKKELVAKLSHDIKTPTASIKAASEVGAALTDNEKIKENYGQIIRKADQINVLVNNLFTATLEELRQLSVTPVDMESRELAKLLENSDYLHRAKVPEMPECLIYTDVLRLQQVFDNIFANSYKYANTEIWIKVEREAESLLVNIEDSGGGVPEEELPLLKEKFKRGSNTKEKEGAGLGLYISDYFMKEMGGSLLLENGEKGLKVTVKLLLSGGI